MYVCEAQPHTRAVTCLRPPGWWRLSHPSADKPMREKHAASGFFATDSNVAVAQRCDVLWIATKPDVVPAVLTEIGAIVKTRDALVVSIAAGVSLDTMEQSIALAPAYC